MAQHIDIHPTAKLGEGVTIMGDLTLGENVEVGANVTLFPNVTVGSATRILPGAVIGRPPISAGTLSLPVNESIRPVFIGAHCVIGANAVLYTDLRVGTNTMIADLSTVREGGRIGNEVVLGRRSTLLSDVTVGDRTRVHDGAHLTGGMVVESDVFFGPLSCSYNDSRVYTQRYLRDEPLICPPVVRRFALIGTGANVGAGVEVGMGAIVAPGAVATKDVPAWTIAVGTPARVLREVAEEDRQFILRKAERDAES